MSEKDKTMRFNLAGEKQSAREILLSVYQSMHEKGYDAVNQIVGYIICGDPTYITNYNNARYLIGLLERDELLEELVRSYVQNNIPKDNAPEE